jgi:hypothetical protein
MFQAIAITALAACLMAPPAAQTAPIDGKWLASMKVIGPAGVERTLEMALDLKSEGDKLTGTVTVTGPRGERTYEILDGKLEGNRFSFATMQRWREGTQVKMLWTGSLEGDELRGEQRREGGERSFPFTARRQ